MPAVEDALLSRVLVEGCSADSLPTGLRVALGNEGLLNAGTVAVAGVLRLGSETGLTVILPKGFGNRLGTADSDSGDTLQNVFLTVRVINRCLREHRFQARYVDAGLFWPSKAFRDAQLVDALEAAFLLHRDFLENGYFWQKENLRKQDAYAHPVNWKRTLDSFPPDLDDGNVSFRHTVHSARVRQPHDFLHRLHATCVEDVFRLLGQERVIAEGRRLDESEVDMVARSPDAVILPLLSRTYRERGRMLLQLMLGWFRGQITYRATASRGVDAGGFCCHFHCVWEHMLRELLDNSGPSGRVLENGLWLEVGEATERGTGAPEMDLRRIVSAGGGPTADCIIDAKDKRITPGTRSGSAGDHYKQIMYAWLSERDRRGQLFNVLVFPSAGGQVPFTLLGRHRWASLGNSDVFEAAADLKTVADCWLERRSGIFCDAFASLVNRATEFTGRTETESSVSGFPEAV